MLAMAELFANYLNAKGVRFDAREHQDGHNSIVIHQSGITTICSFNGDTGSYLSFYHQVVTGVPKDKLVDAILACNALNEQFKWLKFYVDKEGDLMAEDDAILAYENAAEETWELLLRGFHVIDAAKPALMRAIYA